MKPLDLLKYTTRATAAVAVLMLSVSSQAGEQGAAFTMTAIADDSYGFRVIRGDYLDAIEKINAKKTASKESFEAKTNLCVAYVKSGQIDAAEGACAEALKMARKQAADAPRFAPSYLAERYRLHEALALSNHGVLLAVIGNEELARAHFAEAIEKRTTLSAPRANLARIEG